MSTIADHFQRDRELLVDMSSRVGHDFTLVQGAGGNTSVKVSKSQMLVKASGTKLGDAATRDIFVNVPLDNYCKDEGIPEPATVATLRPSIETVLHQLMPQKFVCHLHMLDVLPVLVNIDAERLIKKYIGTALEFAVVPYRKPGDDLAAWLQDNLKDLARYDVIFLRNHGVLIANDDAQIIFDVIGKLKKIFSSKTGLSLRQPQNLKELPKPPKNFHWSSSLGALAISADHLEMVEQRWPVTPDHVVFLGARPIIYDSMSEVLDVHRQSKTDSIIFVRGIGVLVSEQISHAQLQQAEAYRYLLERVESYRCVATLSHYDIAELLDWDAEKYRLALNS